MKKYLCIGPGGMKCVCCFPAPRSKERKLAFRVAKKKEKKFAFKCEEMNKE